MTRPPKYRNTKIEIDGVKYDSKREAARAAELRLLERAGKIAFLRHHVRYPLVVNNVKVCAYEADFTYRDAETGEEIVEDVKSPITRKNPLYRLKNKLMRACHGIEIREVA